MRTIVTGGAGFIGSHVVEALLARGDEVVVVDDLSSGRRENVDSRARCVEHDVREPFSEPADVIFHLAAQADVGTSVERPVFDAEVNGLGTILVLEAARAADARVVFVSTVRGRQTSATASSTRAARSGSWAGGPGPRSTRGFG